MGAEESHELVDDGTPTNTLAARTIPGIAQHITSGAARNIVVMTGAGISTSAGIPDFRSPDTGLYANLARLNLPYAEAVFDISYFRRNPEPFYTLAYELYPGKYRPTIAHAFIRLLEKKGLLLKHFTQNIDCLDRQAGVSAEKIVEAHGSYATQKCIDCAAPFDDEEMLEFINKQEVPHCEVCGGLVKPDIVFFGEQLPHQFFNSLDVPRRADLVIVLGTSLTVQPFAGLPSMAAEGTPRVLVNKERVGDLGSRPDDVVVLDECDDGVCRLAKECGWSDELMELWKSVGGENNARKPVRDHDEIIAPEVENELTGPVKDKDEAVADEVDKITRDVELNLKLTEKHNADARKELDDEDRRKQVTTDKKGENGLSHVFPHIQNDGKDAKKDSSL